MDVEAGHMDVKEAVRIAKEYLIDLFQGESIMNVGLEEVVFEDVSAVWKITIGFSRPWELKTPILAAFADGRHARSYKVLTVNDASREVEALTDRVLKASER